MMTKRWNVDADLFCLRGMIIDADVGHVSCLEYSSLKGAKYGLILIIQGRKNHKDGKGNLDQY